MIFTYHAFLVTFLFFKWILPNEFLFEGSSVFLDDFYFQSYVIDCFLAFFGQITSFCVINEKQIQTFRYYCTTFLFFLSSASVAHFVSKIYFDTCFDLFIFFHDFVFSFCFLCAFLLYCILNAVIVISTQILF